MRLHSKAIKKDCDLLDAFFYCFFFINESAFSSLGIDLISVSLKVKMTSAHLFKEIPTGPWRKNVTDTFAMSV